jgi:hypothetical protein
MKNANRLRIIALALAFIVSSTVCFAQSGGRTLNSAAELKQYLATQPANGPDKPIAVTVSVNNRTIMDIKAAITSAGKYVSLILTGSGLTAIPDTAFGDINESPEGCPTLIGISIPNSVTSIGGAAFAGCYNLASVSIPNSVTNIEGGAFCFCTSLASVAIPNSVTSIGDFAFLSCTSLASVTIPNSVTSIGYFTFVGCTSLATINVASGNSVYSSGNGVLYNKNKTRMCSY